MGESNGRPARNVYADFLRIGSICLVVLGHWLVTSVGYKDGRFEGADVLALLPWTQWFTLVFQVIPVFFLVGGYANAVSWTSHRARGGDWGSWLYRRAARLLMPTTLYVCAGTVAAALGVLLSVDPTVLSTAGWAVALQLWFLPVYIILLALTPAMHAAHRRWGLLVPAVLGIAAVAVDSAVVFARVPLIGGLNYVLVWGCVHQLGFAWQDRSFTASRRLPLALAAAGIVALVVAIWPGPYPVAMVGVPGARINNPSPPSTALLAYSVGQAGLLLAAEPAVSRWLRRPRRSRAVAVGNAAAMTLYLWHMAPVVVVSIALYPTGVLPQPPVASAAWWLLRVVWVVLLTALLVPLIAMLLPVERRIAGSLPMDAGPRRPPAALALVAGLVLVVFALNRFAEAGFAPGGRLPGTTLAAYAAGIALAGAVAAGRRGHPDQLGAPVMGRAHRPGGAPAGGGSRGRRSPQQPSAIVMNRRRRLIVSTQIRPSRARAAVFGATLTSIVLVAGCAGTGSGSAAPPGSTTAGGGRPGGQTSTTAAATTSTGAAMTEGPGAGCLTPEAGGKQVTFPARNGAKIAGVVLGRGRSGVILAHQRGGNLCQWLAYGITLAGKGYHVLLFDFEGDGATEAAAGATRPTIDVDVAAAVVALRKRGATRIVLVGASKGGTAVVGAAATVRPPVNGVVSVSGTTFYDGVSGVDAAAKLTMPVLFIAAEGDSGFATDARALYDASRQRDRKLLVVPGGGHGVDLLDPAAGNADVAQAIEAFLEAHAR